MKKILSAFLFVCFYSQTLSAQDVIFTEEEKQWIKDHPVFEFGYDPDWKPYTFYSDGEYKGIIGEYIERIELATGIDLVPLPNMTWAKSIAGLKNGTVHMVPDCNRTDYRDEFLIYTEPYITEPLVIITRNKFPFVGSFDDLEGLKVALPTDYWTNDLIRNDYPNLTVVDKPNIVKCLEALSTKKVDAMIGSLGVISYYINNKGYTNLKVAAPADIEAYKLSLAFTKEQTVFRDICQKVLNSISLQERSRIRKDWISVRYEYAFNWTRAFTWLLVIGVIAALGFLVIYLWNRALRKLVDQKVKQQLELESSFKEVQKSDEQHKVLLQEIHHRVKNNLQIITSLIRLQANTSDNFVVEKSLNEAIERIRAIALMHENIYNSSELKYISPEKYFKSLADDVINSSGQNDTIKVTIQTEINEVNLQSIVPIALILNELITNSIKHAFKTDETGHISIHLYGNEQKLHLKYSDNGKWMDNSQSKNFGTSLIAIFTEQLDGSHKVTKENTGTFYEFQFEIS